MSLPTGERGLKFSNNLTTSDICCVAPHGGAWIEIIHLCHLPLLLLCVAPHGGAWIEIAEEDFEFEEDEGRSPRGSVD